MYVSIYIYIYIYIYIREIERERDEATARPTDALQYASVGDEAAWHAAGRRQAAHVHTRYCTWPFIHQTPLPLAKCPRSLALSLARARARARALSPHTQERCF